MIPVAETQSQVSVSVGVSLGLIQHKTTVPARPVAPLSRLVADRQNADFYAVRSPPPPSPPLQTRSVHAEHKRPLSLRVRGNIQRGREPFCKSIWPRGGREGKHSNKQACGFDAAASRPVSLPCQQPQQYQPRSCATQPYLIKCRLQHMQPQCCTMCVCVCVPGGTGYEFTLQECTAETGPFPIKTLCAFDKANFSTFVYFQVSNNCKNPSNDFENKKGRGKKTKEISSCDASFDVGFGSFLPEFNRSQTVF